ncbi:MAG: type IV pilus modification protein PilV [Herminiimonas sp.]|nr:type IV pilus modification protein PilV [Herminiimonas sp.]MDO9422008.1 type IV pilus modification protein PilV [Herminiimonas sp.]
MSMQSTTLLKKQSGMMLLEGLIAILVFSLGILALVGMQAVSVKQVTDAKYRSDASLLASQLLGTMWVNLDRRSTVTPAAAATGLKANFDTSTSTASAALTNWKAAVANALPGISDDVNQPTVDVTAIGTTNDGTVTVTIFWLAPGDPSQDAHKYVTVAQIR